MDVKKFSNIDLYGLLGVEISATESEVNQFFISTKLETKESQYSRYFAYLDPKSISKKSVSMPSR